MYKKAAQIGRAAKAFEGRNKGFTSPEDDARKLGLAVIARPAERRMMRL